MGDTNLANLPTQANSLACESATNVTFLSLAEGEACGSDKRVSKPLLFGCKARFGESLSSVSDEPPLLLQDAMTVCETTTQADLEARCQRGGSNSQPPYPCSVGAGLINAPATGPATAVSISVPHC